MSRWKWTRTETGEPVTAFRVEHHLTKEEIARLLCISGLETHARLSQAAVIHYVHDGLKAAPDLEPVSTWMENYAEEEADERLDWAREQAQRFYEKTC